MSSLVSGIELKDVVSSSVTLVVGLVTGVWAGERRIHAERRDEAVKRAWEDSVRRLEAVKVATARYMEARPTRGRIQQFFAQTPPGETVLGVAELRRQFETATDQLRIAVPAAEQPRVEKDFEIVRTWLDASFHAYRTQSRVPDLPGPADIVALAHELEQHVAQPTLSDRRLRRRLPRPF